MHHGQCGSGELLKLQTQLRESFLRFFYHETMVLTSDLLFVIVFVLVLLGCNQRVIGFTDFICVGFVATKLGSVLFGVARLGA